MFKIPAQLPPVREREVDQDRFSCFGRHGWSLRMQSEFTEISSEYVPVAARYFSVSQCSR